MHREDDLIFFDDRDKQRYPGLPDWAPIEVVPGLFADMMEAKLEAEAAIRQLHDKWTYGRSFAEHLGELQQAHVQAIRLQAVSNELGNLAAAEIMEVMLPAPAQ